MVTTHGPRKARGNEDSAREARDEQDHGPFNSEKERLLEETHRSNPTTFFRSRPERPLLVARSVAAPEVRLASVLSCMRGAFMTALPYFNVQPPGGTP